MNKQTTHEREGLAAVSTKREHKSFIAPPLPVRASEPANVFASYEGSTLEHHRRHDRIKSVRARYEEYRRLRAENA